MLFSQDHIVPELDARERFHAIREIVAQLVRAGVIRRESADSLVATFIERENSMTTGIGLGISTPVARSNTVNEVVLAFGRSSFGVEWDSFDKQPVKIILMFINPLPSKEKANLASPVHEGEYWRFKMHLIQSLSPRRTDEGNIRACLSQASSVQEIFAILKGVCDSAPRVEFPPGFSG